MPVCDLCIKYLTDAKELWHSSFCQRNSATQDRVEQVIKYLTDSLSRIKMLNIAVRN